MTTDKFTSSDDLQDRGAQATPIHLAPWPRGRQELRIPAGVPADLRREPPIAVTSARNLLRGLGEWVRNITTPNIARGLCIAVGVLGSAGQAAAQCADPAAVEEVRDMIEVSACSCLGPDLVHDPLTGWPNNAAYVRCVDEATRNAVQAGRLPEGCVSDVLDAAERSVCGKPGAVTCCARGSCSITGRAASCRAKGGKLGFTASCVDACEPPGPLPGLCESSDVTNLLRAVAAHSLRNFTSPFLLQASERHAYLLDFAPSFVSNWYLLHLARECTRAKTFRQYCREKLGPVLHDCLRVSCVASDRWAGRARPRPLPFIRPGAFGAGDLTLRFDKITSLSEWLRPPVLGPKQVSWEYSAEGSWRTRELGGHRFELRASAVVAWTGEHDPTAATMSVRLGGVVREGDVVVDHDLITLRGTITAAGAQVGSIVQDPETGGSNITFTACGGN